MSVSTDNEVEYLRRLKENNTRTISQQIVMIQNRNFVIESKDKILDELIEALEEIPVNYPSVDLMSQAVHMAKAAKRVGIAMPERT